MHRSTPLRIAQFSTTRVADRPRAVDHTRASCVTRGAVHSRPVTGPRHAGANKALTNGVLCRRSFGEAGGMFEIERLQRERSKIGALAAISRGARLAANQITRRQRRSANRARPVALLVPFKAGHAAVIRESRNYKQMRITSSNFPNQFAGPSSRIPCYPVPVRGASAVLAVNPSVLFRTSRI